MGLKRGFDKVKWLLGQFTFDGTINVGHCLTFIALAIAGVALCLQWSAHVQTRRELTARVATIEELTRRLDAQVTADAKHNRQLHQSQLERLKLQGMLQESESQLLNISTSSTDNIRRDLNQAVGKLCASIYLLSTYLQVASPDDPDRELLNSIADVNIAHFEIIKIAEAYRRRSDEAIHRITEVYKADSESKSIQERSQASVKYANDITRYYEVAFPEFKQQLKEPEDKLDSALKRQAEILMTRSAYAKTVLTDISSGEDTK